MQMEIFYAKLFHSQQLTILTRKWFEIDTFSSIFRFPGHMISSFLISTSIPLCKMPTCLSLVVPFCTLNTRYDECVRSPYQSNSTVPVLPSNELFKKDLQSFDVENEYKVLTEYWPHMVRYISKQLHLCELVLINKWRTFNTFRRSTLTNVKRRYAVVNDERKAFSLSKKDTTSFWR